MAQERIILTEEEESSYEASHDCEEAYDYTICEHGIYKGYVGGYCNKCDDYEEKRGGIDKCLNCGRYKYNDQLNEDQVCKIRCRNPNEY